MMRERRPRLGLVIGSGSVKCAAALGLWKALQRNQIPVDMVVGCSGGSIYATGIAFGDDITMIEQATQNARSVAEKFAADSKSRLGKIKAANQGLFSIEDRDSNTPYLKKVRVVSTVDYYLAD